MGTDRIREKVKLLALADALGNVTVACRLTGYSRDSFYRFRALYAAGGEAALQTQSRRKPLLKNRVGPDIEAAVVALALAYPAYGQARVAAILARQGMRLSPAGVRCVWRRHGLTTMALRLQAVEARAQQNGGRYTDAQLAAFAKQRRAAARRMPAPDATGRPSHPVTDALILADAVDANAPAAPA